MPGRMRLALLGAPEGGHKAGWRLPEAIADADCSFQFYVDAVQTAERGKMDAFFFADSTAVSGAQSLQRGEVARTHMAPYTASIDPQTILSALAVVTSRIGLVASITTTYNHPYLVARKVLSVDHISNGRVGWNLVTSQSEEEALNFGFDAHPAHDDRYRRASEFCDVVSGLWDSWDDDAFVRSKEEGVYFDIDKVHLLNHEGDHFKVRGPLNVERSPQGRPVIFQAGSSEPGRELAARTADVVFTAQVTVEGAKAFYDDLKARAARYGRPPGGIKILPGVMPIIGDTMEDARKLEARMEALITDELALSTMVRHVAGLDLRQYPLDGPMPELPLTNASRSRQQLLMEEARRHGWTLRQVARRAATASGHLVLVGTPESVADEMAAWFLAGACDGFNVILPFSPGPLRRFVDEVIPILQRRGLFRTEYEGATLRENLGFSFPENQFTARRARELAGA